MVDPPHNRPFRFNQRFHLEAEVVEEGGVILAKCLLVIADVGVKAHPFKEGQAQPGLQPSAYTEAPGEFAEGLSWRVGEGNVLVEATTGLLGSTVD